MYTPWVWFYNRGADMTVQMTAQRNSFEIATYPVSIVQARNDLGQVSTYHACTVLVVLYDLHVCQG